MRDGPMALQGARHLRGSTSEWTSDSKLIYVKVEALLECDTNHIHD